MCTRSVYWSLLSREPLGWRRFGDEAVVYNPVSGDTHLLNLVEQAAVEEIDAAGQITFPQLADLLAQRLVVDDRDRLETYLGELLQQLSEAGLIVSEEPNM